MVELESSKKKSVLTIPEEKIPEGAQAIKYDGDCWAVDTDGNWVEVNEEDLIAGTAVYLLMYSDFEKFEVEEEEEEEDAADEDE